MPNPWFFFFILHNSTQNQICTSRQTHDFSSSFYITQYKFKCVLRAKPMIFLLISNMYFISDPWFFCLIPNKSIQIQMCTSHQTHDFSAYFLYRIIGNQMCTSSQTHNFSAFSFANIAPNPWFFANIKCVLRLRPMIFLPSW